MIRSCCADVNIFHAKTDDGCVSVPCKEGVTASVALGLTTSFLWDAVDVADESVMGTNSLLQVQQFSQTPIDLMADSHVIYVFPKLCNWAETNTIYLMLLDGSGINFIVHYI